MNGQQVASQITSFISWALANPFAFLLWIVGTVAIVAVAATVLSPLAPAYIRPAGDINKWVYVAGFLYLMKGAGR